MASKGNTKKLTLKTQTSSATDLADSPLKSPKRKISPNQLLPTPSPTTAVNGLNASPNSELPPPRTPTTPTSVNSATISDADSVSLAGERRLVRRSSVICSSGKDKYTFDSEHAHNPSRTVNFRLEERHTRHLGPSMKNATSVFKETIPQTIPSPAPESSEATIKRHSVVHPGQADLPKSVCINGRFQNPWPTWRPPSFTNILKFGFSKDKSNIPSKQDLDLLLPILEPNFPKFVKDGIRVTWLGHATVLVQMHGMNILTDPIFSERASPSQVVGPKRYRDVPCSVHDLPPIHAVVISHSHYDHLDLNSVTLLNARFGSDLRWFVPLGLTDWMNQAGCENVMALDWWEENCVPDFSDVSFVFTASQHWCKRTIGDDNKVLWGGWAVLGPRYRFYYPGDTGYCDVFKQIGHTYGPFDVSAIPIGAYEPRWFMKYQHVDPLEAVKIHEDVKSKFSIGIHWGTFALANEFYLDPPLKLRAALQERQLPENCFITLKHGESKQIGGEDTPQDEPTRKTSNSRPAKY